MSLNLKLDFALKIWFNLISFRNKMCSKISSDFLLENFEWFLLKNSSDFLLKISSHFQVGAKKAILILGFANLTLFPIRLKIHCENNDVF